MPTRPSERTGTETPWLVSVSYQRDALEEFDVQQDAQKRFAKPLGETFTYQSVLFGFIVLALIIGTVEVSRHLTPIFPDAPGALAYHGDYWAAFMPIVILLGVAAIGFARMFRHRQEALRIARIRARGWADVEISATGLIYVTDGRNQRLDWRAVRSVSHAKDKILLDLDQSTIYIPERAFANRAEFLSQYKVIRQAWLDRLMAEVAEKN
ncbi:YcxB family protein [Rhizobium sp. L1K21]|uniref:YcxB family protein n=1 Tax=Rhizobium sp. L1K21 TaxID=2954933 RepID=UPI0020934386|nr:YcxB family protein [Rhizobium sp. L1K21]MCO6184774.1 hypothetical protein [Rhizobium sp. L1K21]